MKKNNKNNKKVSSSSASASQHFDVCIVGAGPAALACLSAIREPYSLDNLTTMQVERANLSVHKLHRPLSVCVIDPNANEGWMHSWKRNFDLLHIQHLRSPVMAHPNLFDKHALLAYADASQQQQQQHDRNDKEDADEPLLYESGCLDMKRLLGLGQTQVGLWKLPSTKLFNNFCDNMTHTLSHTLITGHVVELDQTTKADDGESAGSSSVFHITVVNNNDHQFLTANNVILATGTIGKTIVPHGFKLSCPNVFCWNDPRAYHQHHHHNETTTMTTTTTTQVPTTQPQQVKKQQRQRVLVVGGGLTAVQVALRIVKDGHDCVLCSRRPLMQRHFDIPVEWFDSRSTNKCLSDFYHYTIDERLQQLKQTRDGGSIPPMYLKSLAEVCNNDNDNNDNGGRLTCWVGDIKCIHQPNNDEEDHNEATPQTITVTHNGKEYEFDKVILSCGVQPECNENPLVRNVLEKWPVATHGGLPAITQDLRWQEGVDIFVAGAMAALQVGPDAGNLMGIRRAAVLISNSLDCRCWLREKALTNPFEALMWDSDDSDSDTEETSSDDDDFEDDGRCLTCGDEIVAAA